MDEQHTEEGFTEQADVAPTSNETEKYETTLNDDTNTSLEEDIDEPLLEGNENELQTYEEESFESEEGDSGLDASCAGKEHDDLATENEAKSQGDGDETERLNTEMSGSADHETKTSLADDTAEFVEDDVDDLAADNLFGDSNTGENGASKVEDEDVKENENLKIDEEEEMSVAIGHELETEPHDPLEREELPFISETDTQEVSSENEGKGEADDNDDENDQDEGEENSVKEGQIDETAEKSSQKSETSTLVDDNGDEKADSLLYNETNEDDDDDETIDMASSLTEEIMPNNIERYLQECANDLEGITEVNDNASMENVAPYSEISEEEEDTLKGDNLDRAVEGQESEFLEEQENYNDEDSTFPKNEDESSRDGDQDEQLQMENPPADAQLQSNGDVVGRDDEVPDGYSRERAGSGSQLEDDFSPRFADGGISGGFYGDDDLSSIFSDDGRDMSNILQENSILKEAMMQLRKDNPEGFTDTVSETSDEVDDFYIHPYGGDNKVQTSKWMAERDLNDAKFNEILREKRDSQAKMRQLEREKAMVERKYRQDKMEREFLEERLTTKSSQLQEEIRNLKQENQRLKRGSPQGKGTTPRPRNKEVGNKKEPTGIGLLGDNGDSDFPGRNGFAIDIAILAKENEKLSEIIDHLQETPRNDSLDDFVDNLDKYVPKEEFTRLENEKLKLETALREKERMLKEQERLMEETKFDLEEEIEIMKESLKKAENKNKEKAKLLSQNDMKMIDVKAKFTEKVSQLESRLEQEVSKKAKLESVVINLKKCNDGFEKQIQDMNNRVQKLQSREMEMEAKNRREMAELQERLRKETEEKNKLARNVEALLQDLMQLKGKILEETEKHVKEQEQLKASIETEKGRMTAGQEQDIRRLKSELEEEKKRNEQLIRRMAEIPGETIVSVMENTTEAALFESPFSDFEPGLLERTQQEEQYKEPEKDNMVMDLNDVQATRENQLRNAPKPSEDNSSEMNGLQKKLLEVTKYNSIMQRRNKEIEEENINLKEKVERVGRDVSRMRELEDKNEELQGEIARNTKKRNEMQKKQENMVEEIEDITKKLNKVEGNNNDLNDEVDRLTKKIKTMEQEFGDEKSKLASSLEQEKRSAIDETERRLEEQKAKCKRLDNEIDDLQSDVKTLKDAKRAAEEKYVNDTKELVERHNLELASERERYRQLQDELNNNAGAVRRVTEEWEQMLRNAVSRYDEDLQKNEDERRKMVEEFQRQKNEMKARFDREKAKLELRAQEIERIASARSPMENEIMQENVAVSYQDPQTDLLLEGTPGGDFSEDGSPFSNDLGEKQDKINALAVQKRMLEQKFAQMQRNHDIEKNDLCTEHKKEKQKLEETLTEDYKRRLEENKRYYEGRLDDLRRKHEKEEEELADRFKREKSELEDKIKQDLSSNLSSRSTGLENKIQDLVSQKVQEQKEITKKTEEKCNTVVFQMKSRMKEMHNEKNEMKRKFEREKKVLEATIQALTKELEKVRQEKKDLKKKQKKEKAEMEEAFENEKKEMKQMWEKCKLDTLNQIEDEWIEKMKNENAKSEILKEELQGNFEARIKQMKLKFKAEKGELERRLADAISESNSLKEAKKEIEAAMEEDYKRKLQKEKENVKSTLQGLRQEIAKLQEHRKQLQSQMANRESQPKVNTPALLDTNAQVLAKLDNEYQEHMKKEKEHHESRMREMEEEIEKLHEDLSQIKVKARQEKSRVKAEFEKEREEIEEQFDKERNEWRTRMNLITSMHPREIQTVSLTFLCNASQQVFKIFAPLLTFSILRRKIPLPANLKREIVKKQKLLTL